MKKELFVFLLLVLITCFGVFFLTSNGHSSPMNYLVGQVIDEDENTLFIKVDAKKSNLKTPLTESIYSIHEEDIGNYFTDPQIGDIVRITCSEDMSILIAIYDENEVSKDAASMDSQTVEIEDRDSDDEQ